MAESVNSCENLLDLHQLQRQAALYLAQGHRTQDVAEQLGVSRRSVELWMQAPLFKKLVQQYQEQIAEETTRYTAHKLQELQAKAIDRIEHLMEHAESEAIQFNSAKFALENGTLRVQRGIDLSKTAPGTVILHDRMLIAMQQVADLTGDSEMMQALTPFTGHNEQNPSENGHNDSTIDIEPST